MPEIFNQNYINNLHRKLQEDENLINEANLASISFCFKNTDNGEETYFNLHEGKISIKVEENNFKSFSLEGDSTAWEDLIREEPLNRLVRKNRVKVMGDKRLCMKNWKLIWTIGQQIKRR